MSEDREREHCERVAMARLNDTAIRTHPDGVFRCVAMADIALLVQRERAAAAAEARDKAIEQAARILDNKDECWVCRDAAKAIRALRGGVK